MAREEERGYGTRRRERIWRPDEGIHAYDDKLHFYAITSSI